MGIIHSEDREVEATFKGDLMAKDTLTMLKNYQKPKGYKYYNHFITKKGDYVIWSRDGKRYYIDNTKNSKLLLLRVSPFKSATDVKKYLKRRLSMKTNFPSDKLKKVI